MPEIVLVVNLSGFWDGECKWWIPACQALCTEASLAALRRTYPQIYESDDKLLIDPAAVAVTPRDFFAAHASLTPASHRSAAAHARSGFG